MSEIFALQQATNDHSARQYNGQEKKARQYNGQEKKDKQ
jgi:hypothetical protein